jgi:hypothetical protein
MGRLRSMVVPVMVVPVKAAMKETQRRRLRKRQGSKA